MTTSTDAILFYGYCMDEDFEAPWNASAYDGDPAEWYNTVEPNDPNICDWMGLPCELVIYQSCEFPLYGFAIPGMVLTVTRGDAAMLESYYQELNLEDKLDKFMILQAFMERYIIPTYKKEPEPGWWLVSYWG